MGFNSIEFVLLLGMMMLLYWSWQGQRRRQNMLLLAGSYLFYGFWDWRFLFLIIISSAVDFYVGRELPKHKNTSKAKNLLYLSLATNLGMLGFFKYFNFFINSFQVLFATIGINLSLPTLQIILPVGISFYTFQTLSYTIDIYRGRLKPTDDWLTFFAFVSFFPQLVAGPIERASFLIPQFEKDRKFDLSEAKEGLRFILYGLFKKVVIADYCGMKADEIFSNYETMAGSDLLIGAYLFFGLQLYADFSAYSEIAIGSARLFGFKLSRNFAYPLFSKNIEELWQRWHITLSKWFRDYVLLLGLRSKRWKKLGSNGLLLLMFFLIGLWHGANFTFVLWGLLHGAMFLLYQKMKKRGWVHPEYRRSELRDMGSILTLNFFAGLVLIFFRAPSLGVSFDYISRMFSFSLFSIPTYAQYLAWPIFLIVWEWNFRNHWHGLAVAHWKKWQRWTLYVLMTIATMYYFGEQRDFIYFQF